MDCIDRLLAKDSYLDNFGVSFNDSIDKIFPFQLWYSSSNSMYDIFNLLKVETEQDKVVSKVYVYHYNHYMKVKNCLLKR